MKRGWLSGVILLVLLCFSFLSLLVLADTASSTTGAGATATSGSSTIMGFLSSVGHTIMSVGDPATLGLTNEQSLSIFSRLLFGLAIFTLFFATITAFGGANGKPPFNFFNRGQALIFSLAVTLIGMYFMPAAVLLAAGTGWSVFFAFLLIGTPIIGLFYLMWQFPKDAKDENRGTVFLKLVLCLLLLWVLQAMKASLLVPSGAGVVDFGSHSGTVAEFIYYSQVLAGLAAIWYFIKLFIVGRSSEPSAELATRQGHVGEWFKKEKERRDHAKHEAEEKAKHAREHAEHKAHEDHEKHEREHKEHEAHQKHHAHVEHKKHEVAGVAGPLVKAIESLNHAENMLHLVVQDSQGHHKTQLNDHLKEFFEDFTVAWRQMRTMPSKFHDHPQERAELTQLLTELEAAREYFHGHIQNHKFHGTEAEIAAQVKELRTHLRTLWGATHNFFNRLEDFTRK